MGRTVMASLGLLAALPVCAQYVGKVSKDDKAPPELRSIAVLEWTGDAEKPTASRLVPVAVLDGGELQDGGIYLARPEPLALVPEVEYELQQDGRPVGLFDIRNAGQQLGTWVGLGAWKPLPSPKPLPSAKDMAKTDFDDGGSDDQPVLHRKHHAGDAPSGGAGKSSGSGDSSAPGQPSDPDRPTLHKKSTSTSTSTDGSPSGGNASSAGSGADTDSDPDRPTLHKKGSGSDSAASSSAPAEAPSDDPDRPTLHKSKATKPADTASVDPVAEDSDPDRPRLKRGKPSGSELVVAPSLKGLPPDSHQMVAVSDAQNHAPHPWDYAWANPGDEARMKSSLEDMARDALGLNPPVAAAKPSVKRATTKTATTRKSARPAPAPPPPPPLDGEQFRVFELAYGSGATLVLSAHTDGTAGEQKFVTLVAQPDLYGNVLVLLKNVTDGAHLDDKPRMRLVDAVDAMADNRGELLFELRGSTQRQFALYRVLRGQAEQLFVTGGGQFGTEKSE